ncbi:MAG: M48 family metalloprotease [Candidatus Omnitrophica bacterium]|nr:M48 family metalloprotease [Candidatus Omnitrophota bacterium]
MKNSVLISSLLLMTSLTGCSTEYNLATRQQETLMYSTDREVQIGFSVSQKVDEKYDIVEDVDVNARVERLFNRLVEVSDRKDIVYFIKVIEEDEMINAFSLPGGYVYLFSGLVEKARSDDELAGVIAHEIGHITARHGVKRLQAAYGAMILTAAAAAADGGIGAGVNLTMNTILSEYSQEDEFEADRLAVKYMRKAGFDPYGVEEFFDVLRKEQDKEIRPIMYFRSHPHIPQRKAKIRQEITGQIEFRDYLNLIDGQ